MSIVLGVAYVVAVVYAIGVVACLFGGAMNRTSVYYSDRVRGARFIVRSPLWPADAARSIARGIRNIREDAKEAR